MFYKEDMSQPTLSISNFPFVSLGKNKMIWFLIETSGALKLELDTSS